MQFIDSLSSKMDISIDYLDSENFVKGYLKHLQLEKVDIDKYNAVYFPEADKILVQDRPINVITKEYLVLHELVHAIRDARRLNRYNIIPSVPKVILGEINRGFDNDFHGKIFRKREKQQAAFDLRGWREESVCDIVSLFLCVTEENINRNEIVMQNSDLLYIVFPPMVAIYPHIISKNKLNDLIKTVEQECIITLKYIYTKYLGEQLDMKKFNEFFKEETRMGHEVAAKRREEIKAESILGI